MKTTARWNHRTLWTLLGIVALGLVMPLAAASPAPAFHAPNPNAPPQSWAWGATFVKGYQGQLSGSNSNPGGTSAWNLSYTVHEFLGWNTVVTQTNTSSTSFTLSAQRAMAASFFLQANGNEGSYSLSLNVTAQGWESDHGSSNFTTTGSVLLNGTTPVAALAVENAQGATSGNLTATSSATLTGPTSGSYNGYASEASEAQGSLVFTPSLGLFPMNLSSGAWWTSSANYTAQGSYAIACHYGYSAVLPRGSSGGGANCGSSGSASGSGPITLMGADHDIDTALHGDFHKVTLGFIGGFGFELADGLIFLPSHADLYSGAAPGGSVSGSPASTGAQIGLNYVDVQAGATHAPVGASNLQFAPQVATSLGGVTGTAMVAPAASSSPSALNAYSVQGLPESASAAEQANACLLGGCAASPTSHSGLLLLLGLVAVGAVVLAIVGAVMVSRSRRPKMPVGGYSSHPPSAFLLNQNVAPAPGNAPQRPSPRPAGQQDPLGHLY